LSTLVVVHCYAGDKELVEAALPQHLHHGYPVLILSPEDAPVEINHPGVTCRSAGLAGWKGLHTPERQVAHWKFAVEFGTEYVLLHDSDSVCLTRELPSYLYEPGTDMWCNVLCHEVEHDETDQMNFVPPYFMSTSVLARIIEDGEALLAAPDTTEWKHDGHVAIDGFYGTIAKHLGLTVRSFPDGATTWPPSTQNLGRDAANGARFIHGFKDKQTLDHLQIVYGDNV